MPTVLRRESRPGAPGLYVHVPFCSAICPYCDFSVLRAGMPARKRFVDHLVAEVALAACEIRQPELGDRAGILGAAAFARESLGG